MCCCLLIDAAPHVIQHCDGALSSEIGRRTRDLVERSLGTYLRRFRDDAGLADADVAFANLETPVDPTRPVPRWVYETLHYNAPPDYLAAWEGTARHRVFSLCNNHALDQGAEGLERTRGTVLAFSQHRCVGGPRPEDAVAALEVDGVRMGIAAVTECVPESIEHTK